MTPTPLTVARDALAAIADLAGGRRCRSCGEPGSFCDEQPMHDTCPGRIARAALAEMARLEAVPVAEPYFKCDTCGPHVIVDEDGCCVQCGEGAEPIYPAATPSTGDIPPPKAPCGMCGGEGTVRVGVPHSMAVERIPCTACAPPPATPIGAGMEPGQRCTRTAVHNDPTVSNGLEHEFDERMDATWKRGEFRNVERCPYVQPPPTGKACETWCGEHFDLHCHGRPDEGHPPGKGIDGITRGDGMCWCSTACKLAGKPTHPTPREEP